MKRSLETMIDLLHHCARVPVKYMFFNLLHPENALVAILILVTLLGIITEVKLLQFWKADSPMLVTLLGMVIDVKLVQFWNAFFPILVTLLGMVKSVIFAF